METRTVGRRSTLLSLALPALLGACSSLAPHETSLPDGAVEVAAPQVYREWFQRTEACSRLSGEFSTVKFYVVPGVETFSTVAGQKVGQWIEDGSGSRLIIAGNYQNHEMVVRHEMLHALLHREGHPSDYFVSKCQLTWESWNGANGTAIAGL
ncbi:MAG: hypothetical protein HOP28_11555 [Gemmatimonadales bacterium]|nr:hypothetical protein [Gemmatimonadales bacterium]